MACDASKCVGGGFRDALACIVNGLGLRPIIIDNGAQYTSIIYVGLSSAEEFNKVRSIVKECVVELVEKYFKQQVDGYKVIDGEGQLLFIFSNLLLAVKLSIYS